MYELPSPVFIPDKELFIQYSGGFVTRKLGDAPYAYIEHGWVFTANPKFYPIEDEI